MEADPNEIETLTNEGESNPNKRELYRNQTEKNNINGIHIFHPSCIN